jgi:uncharacterized protein YukE
MVAEMVGSNPEELVSLAQTMRRAGQRLDSTWQDIDTLLRTVAWAGPAAETFRADWGRHRRQALADTATLLERASTALVRNADEQRQASTEAGGSDWGGPGTQGPGGPGTQAPPTSPSDLDDYMDQAYDNAGIDPDNWDPDGGVDENRENIEAVYEYYSQLYRDHPEMLWSGMAALIGPSFYAGFMDLDTFADMADVARRLLENPPPLPPGVSIDDVFDQLFPGAVGPSMRELAAMSASEIAEEFRFYERTFLDMQQQIFVDMAPLHEAYATDGIEGIRSLAENGDITPDTLEAWEMIDEGARTGDVDLIQRGNEALLLREQQVVIDDEYQAMYDRNLTGPAVTYLMTQVGAPSVPGAQGFADVFPWDTSFEVGIGPDDVGFSTPDHVPFTDVGIPSFGVSADNPVQGTLTVTTPFADGNIAHFDDRWALIQQDTLPAYLDIPRDDVLDVLATPVGDRADALTLQHQVDDIVHHLVTDWNFDLDQ